MATKVVQQGTVSAKLIGRWEQVCQKLGALAEVPESSQSCIVHRALADLAHERLVRKSEFD